MKKAAILISMIAFIYACGGDAKKETKSDAFDAGNVYGNDKKNDPEHEKKGIGKFTNVELGATLNKDLADAGTKIYELKCSACHKLTGEKLVGPGWKGVTSRRKAEWIMNFATNTDEMINKDPAAQALLEECMVRMPNQNLTDNDARSVYEFMRKNDGVQ
jgi:mono/diheme cytochrome c family protein